MEGNEEIEWGDGGGGRVESGDGAEPRWRRVEMAETAGGGERQMALRGAQHPNPFVCSLRAHGKLPHHHTQSCYIVVNRSGEWRPGVAPVSGVRLDHNGPLKRVMLMERIVGDSHFGVTSQYLEIGMSWGMGSAE